MPIPLVNRAFSPDMRDFARVSLNREPTEYKSSKDFQNQNPQYIILYAQEASQDPERKNRSDVRKALREISAIKKSFLRPIVVTGCAPESAIPHLDKTCPVLVCGFFGEHVIKDFVEDLHIRGYDAHVSLEGTCKYF